MMMMMMMMKLGYLLTYLTTLEANHIHLAKSNVILI